MDTKIYISCSSKDISAAESVIEFLEALGVPSSYVFCQSIPGHLMPIMPNDKNIDEEWISQFIHSQLHIIKLFSVSYMQSYIQGEFFQSQLAEQLLYPVETSIILLPGLTQSDIHRYVDRHVKIIRFDVTERTLNEYLTQFRDKICSEFDLNPPIGRQWSIIKRKLVYSIKEIPSMPIRRQQQKHNSISSNLKKEKKDRPTVFLSYNWGSEKTADKVEERLSPLCLVLRDKNSIKPWGSISAFMKKIRQTDLVVVIVSNSYLKSIACLYEIMQLVKDDNWNSHSMFIVEDSAKGIYTSFGQVEYVKYWEEERKKLQGAISGIDPALTTSQAIDLKKIRLIQLHIDEFMDCVKDSNNPSMDIAREAIAERVLSSQKESETEAD